ncbi:MAG: nickel pincer cofactor biosynthesis protein LarB [Myxococcota bacterium]
MSDESKSLPDASRYIRDLGLARIDHGRRERTGAPEAIYAAGKTVEAVIALVQKHEPTDGPLIVTRMTDAQLEAMNGLRDELTVHEEARLAVLGREKPSGCRVAVVAAGTSDRPVAEEAAWTLHALGHEVTRFYDVGVAGLHRVLEPLPEIVDHDHLIVVAGMEAALPSVLGGLTDLPMIAVPTSVGYGAHFNGLTALLGMLNSCAPGMSVVNIDNGFGAALAAHRVLRRLGRH